MLSAAPAMTAVGICNLRNFLVQSVLGPAHYRVAPASPQPGADFTAAGILSGAPPFTCRTRQVASALPPNDDPDSNHAC